MAPKRVRGRRNSAEPSPSMPAVDGRPAATLDGSLPRRDTRGMSGSAPPDLAVRRAEVADAAAVGRLLHDFNAEFDEATPGAAAVADRVRTLLAAGEMTVLLGGDGPDGLAVLRFRPAVMTEGLECYLEDLYVVPGRRGRGLGRAIMESAMEVARREGAVEMHLGTSEDDVAARALYESLGFSNRDQHPEGPVNYFYEREL